MEIYLVRHTKVAVSKDYCYGISDVDLSESYRDDFEAVKKKLQGHTFTKSYTSSLKRCKMLAYELADSPMVSDALIEMDLGKWELLKWSEIDQKLLDDWMGDFVNVAPPNAENFMDFSMKSVLFFDELVKNSSETDRILLVTHSGVIRSLICHVLNLSLANAFNFEVDYGSVSKIEIFENWYKLKYLNY
jgi:alpha-ribazole phosphatase